MGVVELPKVVLQDLEGLVVRRWDVRHLLDLMNRTLHIRVVHAVRPTPGVGAGATLRDRAPRLAESIHAPCVGGSLPGALHRADERVRLGFGQKVVKGDHPRRRGDHINVVTIIEPLHNRAEHVIHISGLVDWFRGDVQELPVASRAVVPQVTGIAGVGTVNDHPSRILLTFSGSSIARTSIRTVNAA